MSVKRKCVEIVSQNECRRSDRDVWTAPEKKRCVARSGERGNGKREITYLVEKKAYPEGTRRLKSRNRASRIELLLEHRSEARCQLIIGTRRGETHDHRETKKM